MASIGRPRACVSRRASGARRLVLALLATVVLGAWVQAGPAHGDRAERRVTDWGVRATVGAGGHVVADTWAPVTVTLQPTDPFRGRILLATGSGGAAILQSRSIEVGAGVEKRYQLLAPPGVDLQVQVVEDGTEEAVTLQPRGERVDGFLVGTLGGIDASAVPPVTLPMTDQRATAVAVDDGLLELGPRALESLATLVVRQVDLAGLTDAARRAVTTRVADGATLVVTAVTDPDLGLPWRAFTEHTEAGLVPSPGAWGASAAALVDPAAGTPLDGGAEVVAIAAGAGRLVATTLDVGGAGAAGEQRLWEDVLQPGERAVGTGESRRFANLPGEVEQAFGGSTGEPPSFLWLAVFFVVYVLVTGPVVGMVMSRRRRPEMAWVVVPVVTALFAGAAFVGASGARPRVGVSARVATWVDGVGTTVTVAGVRSPQAGQHTLTLPGRGWDVASASWEGSARVLEGTDDTAVTVNVPSQSLGAVVAWQPLDREPPLDVEVALFATEARLEVTNTSDRDLDDLTLRLATEAHDLGGTLAAGETLVRTVPLDGVLPRQRDPFGEQVRGPFDQPGTEDLGILARWDVLDGTPGLAVVTATSEGDLGLGTASVDGAAPMERGTLLAVAATPSVTDDATTPYEVGRDLVAATRNTWRDTPLTLSGTGPATLRFRLPHEGAVQSLALALHNDAGRFRGVEPMPMPPPVQLERCGLLEHRDPATGDVLQASDVCTAEFPCPADATTCSWSDDGAGRPEGQACFADGTCVDLVWTVQGPQDGPDQVPRVAGMQVWNHVDRRWDDVAVDADGAVVRGQEVGRWLSPLGEVWVRATGELMPFDLAPQGVSAQLENRS